MTTMTRAMIATKNKGIASVPNRKDRLRVIFAYSCLATTHSLRMAQLLRALYDPDENIVQRWFGDFKALDLDPVARRRSPEHLLRAAALRQGHAPIAVDLPRFQHARHIREVALPCDGHSIARKTVPDMIDLAVQH